MSKITHEWAETVEHETKYLVDVECQCGYRTTGSPSWLRRLERSHAQYLDAAMSRPPTELLGVAEGKNGALRTFWIDNLFSPDPPPYEPGAWDKEKNYTVRIPPPEPPAPWPAEDANFYEKTGAAWIVGIQTTRGRDRALVGYESRYVAMAAGIKKISALHLRGWDVKLFDEVSGEVAPVLSHNTHLTHLIETSRRAKTTKARINRIHEINEALGHMNTLKLIKEDLLKKLEI